MKHNKFFLSWALIIMLALTVGCQKAPTTPPDSLESNQVAVGGTTEETESTDEPQSSIYPLELTDSRGVVVTLTEEPTRIISLAPSTTEILYYLDSLDRIVGRTTYCDFPNEVQDIADVGGMYDPNIEAIISANPDLVLASTHADQTLLSKLDELKIPVAFVNSQADFEGTYSDILSIGTLINKKERAEEVVEEMRTSIAALQASVEEATADGTLPKVYYMMWYGDSDSTAGGDTFIGEMLRLAGGQNIAEDISGWSITKEAIAAGDPDLIIVEAGMGVKEALPETPFYQELRAVKEGNVFEVDSAMMNRQGPRLTMALDALANILHPERTK